MLTGDDGEPKPADDKKPDDAEDTRTDDEKAADAAKAALFGAPDGDYEITLPENAPIDAAALAAATPLFKELGLSNEGATKLVTTYAEAILPGVVQQVIDGVNTDVAAQQAAWATEAKESVASDTAFGGKPLAEVQQVAAKALDRFGGAEFRQFCDETGMGNHPALLKFAYLAGTQLSEDTSFERGGASPNTPKTREQKYYTRESTG